MLGFILPAVHHFKIVKEAMQCVMQNGLQTNYAIALNQFSRTSQERGVHWATNIVKFPPIVIVITANNLLNLSFIADPQKHKDFTEL